MQLSSADTTIRELQRQIPVRLQREGVPGGAVAIVGEDGTLWEEGFGLMASTDTAPVTPDTLFGLQSCSKTFTATAVLVAVQEGALDLDRPMVEYLPGVHLQSRHEPHPERSITLRHLLSHKAGLTHEAPVGNNYTAVSERDSFEAHIDSIQRTWLRYPVGQRYAYSNLGIDLAGYILQQISGLSFSEYVRRKLLIPLGMKRSTFDADALPSMPDCARGYDPFLDAARVPLPQHVPMIPSGGLYSSVRDVARFLRFQLNRGCIDGRRVLEERLLDEMLTVPRSGEGQFEGYGLGVAINRFRDTKLYHHSGGGFGFLTDMLWCPTAGLGVVFLTNCSSHALQWSLPYGILDRLVGSAPERAHPHLPTKPCSDASRHAVFAGQYIGRLPDCWEVCRRGNGLVMCRPGGKDVRRLHFYLPDRAATQTAVRTSHWRFLLDDRTRPICLQHVDSGTWYDYNGGSADPPGEDRPEWRAYVGTYVARVLGGVPWLMNICRDDGHLCLKLGSPLQRIALRLNEHRPGLFFTSTGEAVDFTGESPLFCGVPVQRIGTVEEMRNWGVLLRGQIHAWRMKRRRR